MKPKRDEVDMSASTEVLRKLAQKYRDRCQILEPRVVALEAELKTVGGLDGNASTLLEEIAQALREATEVSNPIQAAVLEPSGVRSSNGNPIPGAATKAPRRYSNELREALWAAVNQFESAKLRAWAAPEPKLRAPMVRCRLRDCPAMDINVPAWRDYRGGKRVYSEKCMSCGNPLEAVDLVSVTASSQNVHDL